MDADLEARWQRAAADRADATLAAAPATDFDHVLGVVRCGGGRARRTGAAFTDAVAEHTRRP